ncbi:MAG: GNAT family N-acetyltransferase [Candidatus Aminicenantales bacterium]
MQIRRVRQKEIPDAVELARSLNLDYPGMEADPLWVAKDAGEIVGLVALKTHPDCLELCALGVDPRFEGQGVGRALVEALGAEAPGDVYLATIIPGFFESLGFHIIKAGIPATLPAKRTTTWCEGCPQERCAVMLRNKS